MTHEDELRADVARNVGRARAIPLLRLGQHMGMEYWRLGPGQPVARPSLDEAIAAFDEALGLVDRELPLHTQTEAMLGWLVGTRHLAHSGPDADRERGVALLESAIDAGGPGWVQGTMARLVLGQLLTLGVLSRTSGDPMAALTGSAAGTAALDRAEVVLRPLLEPGRGQIEQTAEMARILLELGSLVRTLTGGITGLLGVGPVRIGQQLQDVQQRLARTARVTLRPDQFFFADDLARRDPLDRPGAVVVDTGPPDTGPPGTAHPGAAHPGAAHPGTAPDRGAPPTRPQPAAPALRAALLARMPGGVAGLLTIIDGRAPLPDVDAVDRWVALGSTLVEARDATDADRLLFAAALCLRSVVDGGGWADEGSDDVHAAAEGLDAVGHTLLAEPPETLAAALRLATILDERRPALRLRSRLAARLGV